MPLVKATLVNDLKAVYNANITDPTDEQTQQINDMANAIATAVDNYIKSATITVAAGIPVTTAGSPSAQTGATTAPAIATIS